LAQTERLSLYKELQSSGYDASVIATYNLNFSFYERVVLRRLFSSGCRHNVILADASQVGRELFSPHTRPQLCGFEYGLLPIVAPGAFHAKFILQLGRRSARLILGSHNLTLSGFGLNREIATIIDVLPGRGEPEAARVIWQFVRAWTKDLPSQIRELINATERIAPWLNEKSDPSARHSVICSTPDGPSMLSQLSPRLDRKVRRIVIVSPYFDKELAFVQELIQTFDPVECIIGIHPSFSEISPEAVRLTPTVKFVDLSKISSGQFAQRLHAKLYCFEFDNGENLVVTGSANASRPAWLADTRRRNAEAMCVHDRAAGLWARLGLADLSETPEVDEEGWDSVKRRLAERTEKNDVSRPLPAVATESAQGFLVDRGFLKNAKAPSIRVFIHEESAGTAEEVARTDVGALCVFSDPRVRESATRLEVAVRKEPPRIALVHHVSHLLDKAAGNLRQSFKDAMNGLPGDPGQLGELMKVVEKVIFDEPIFLESSTKSASRFRKETLSEDNAYLMPTSLAVSARDISKGRRRRRLVASSDLALCLDALIHFLGVGLLSDSDSSMTVRHPEEALRDEQQPADGQDSDEEYGRKLAKMCRGKINRLFNRMVRQLESAATNPNNVTGKIGQLAAVLGVVKYLRQRQNDFDWRPRGEELVAHDRQWKFVKDVARLLYAPNSNLAAVALDEHDGEEFDELTSARALLSWLALNCELDFREIADTGRYDREEIRENAIRLGYFLPIVSACAADEKAAELLTNVARGDLEGEQSATYYLKWVKRVEKAVVKSSEATSAKLSLGDIAYPNKVPDAPLSVVVEVGETSIGLFDLDTEQPKKYKTGFLAKVESQEGTVASRD